MMKKIIVLFLSCLSVNCFATVYKCTNIDGSISYTNTQIKNNSCMKTDIEGQVQTVRNSNSSSSPSSSSGNTSYSPSGNKEDKRNDILGKELENEKSELAKTKSEIEKLEQNKANPSDIEKKKDILRIHEQNIQTLEKELNIKK